MILLTAKVQGADQKRFANLGVSAVLFKPFDPLTLAQQMSEALGWKDSHSMSQPPDSNAKELEGLLRALWKKNYGLCRNGSRLCATRTTELASGSSTTDTQMPESAAHKLAGILGTFGLPEGSRLASKIEG